tara:strand:- start:6 stop:254 length:249 start_codon:yes stop_codon:yes gene_type:complete
MEDCAITCTLFEKKTIVILTTIGSMLLLLFSVYQFIEIQKENEDDRDKTSIHLLNLTTIISFLLWCFAFGLNKEIMSSDIHN